MTLYDALNLAPSLLVGVGLMALAFTCLSMAIASSDDEGLVPRAIHYTSIAGFLMILGFFIFCGSLLTDDRLTALATVLGLSAQDMSWGFLHICGGLMFAINGNLIQKRGAPLGTRVNSLNSLAGTPQRLHYI